MLTPEQRNKLISDLKVNMVDNSKKAMGVSVLPEANKVAIEGLSEAIGNPVADAIDAGSIPEGLEERIEYLERFGYVDGGKATCHDLDRTMPEGNVKNRVFLMTDDGQIRQPLDIRNPLELCYVVAGDNVVYTESGYKNLTKQSKGINNSTIDAICV